MDAVQRLGYVVVGTSLLCLAAHLVGLALAPEQIVALVPMLVLSVGCASCAVRILRRGPESSELWVATAFGASMVALHLVGHAQGGGHGVTTLADLVLHAGVMLGGAQALIGLWALILIHPRLGRIQPRASR